MVTTTAAGIHAVGDLVGRYFTHFFVVYSLVLNSCVSLAQDDLPLVDFTVATALPDFSLVDMRDGSSFNTADYPGAVFVIEFYFAGCGACNQNAANVNRLQREFASNPKVKIVELSVDCRDEQYRTWMANHPPAGPVLNGCDAEVVDNLGVTRFPTTYVFAPNRREAMRGVGVWSRSTYSRIQSYLKQVR